MGTCVSCGMLWFDRLWGLGLAVLKVLDRLPNDGDVDFLLSFSLFSRVFGAVKMDWKTFIEPAAKALGPLDGVSCSEQGPLHCCRCIRKEGRGA